MKNPVYRFNVFGVGMMIVMAIYSFVKGNTVFGFIELLLMLINLPFAIMYFKKK